MKFLKPVSFFIILTMTGLLLTACKNETSYIHDQRGKAIPVTNSGSDTYIFKLSGIQIDDEESVTEVLEESVPEVPETTEEPLDTPELPEEDPIVGPKTGEP